MMVNRQKNGERRRKKMSGSKIERLKKGERNLEVREESWQAATNGIREGEFPQTGNPPGRLSTHTTLLPTHTHTHTHTLSPSNTTTPTTDPYLSPLSAYH